MFPDHSPKCCMSRYNPQKCQRKTPHHTASCLTKGGFEPIFREAMRTSYQIASHQYPIIAEYGK